MQGDPVQCVGRCSDSDEWGRGAKTDADRVFYSACVGFKAQARLICLTRCKGMSISRHIVNLKFYYHDQNSTELSGAKSETAKPTESCIPQPMPTEDMEFLDDMKFLDDLVQGMPTFGQTSISASNVAGQMPFHNGTLGSLEWEALSTCSTKEKGSVLLDQTERISAETRTDLFYRQSISSVNQIHKDNIVLPGVFTARTPPEVSIYGQGGYNPTNFPSAMAPSNQYNAHPTMPPTF